MKEEEIIACIRKQKEDAAELFLMQYRPLMRYIVSPFLDHDQDIEECINDITLKVCLNIERYDSLKGSWNAWITAISRNTAINKTRSNRRNIASVSLDAEDAKEIPSSEPTPEEIVLKREKQAMFKKAVNGLSEQEKIIFYRRYYYQQSIRQIAAELGMTEKAAEGKLYRIRQKLKKLLGGEFYE